MKHTFTFLVLPLLFLLMSCESSVESGENTFAEKISEDVIGENNFEIASRKLIREGRIEFETDDLGVTRKIILEAVAKHKAYVSSDLEDNYAERIRNTLIIRVPAENFEALYNDATVGVGEFDNKEINVKDVTAEYLDIEVRMTTKKQLEKRYTELLSQAKNVTEILEIENELGKLRADIESTEGRLKYLKDRISFSTLTISFYESNPVQTAFGGKFKSGFRNGWENLIWFFVALINIWPFILFAFGIVFGIRYYRRKKR
ncbi:DUF4349 domain-containing protein [Robertkochia solimangrovi]|uniref:DUF4349 domain-containing protein n=1 Tax=Robertkochia solimangrovi TaxID=2213046 RepID=UPI00117C7876|nr:DUF4349 domain-containing protein [Robertkochia solimangrovi]TRZ46340.1 DUF4349 domain-containing protein [Robertkochia solimangrovi]